MLELFMVTFINTTISQLFLTQCLDEIVNIYFKDKLIYTLDFQINPNFPSVNFKNSSLIQFQLTRPEVYLINLHNNNETLPNILKELDSTVTFNPRAQFLIVHSGTTILDFQIFHNYNVYNYKVMLLEHIDDSKDILGRCHDGKFIHYRDWTFSEPELNFLRVGYIVKQPYTVCTNCTEKEGIEMDVFNIVLKKLRVWAKFNKTSYVFWGVKENGTYEGIWQEAAQNRSDVIMGALHCKGVEFFDFDMTFTYMEDSLVLVAPKARLVAEWKRLAHTYTPEAWITLSAVLFIKSLILIIFNKVHNEKVDAFAVFKVYLDIPNEVSKKWSSRVLFLTFLFSCLVINTGFKSKLLYFLCGENYDKDINSLRDLAEAKLTPGLDDFCFSLFNDFNSPYEDYIREKRIFCYTDWKCTDRMAHRRDLVTVKIKRQVEYYGPRKYIDDKRQALIHIVPFDLLIIQIHLFFRRGHPLFDRINRMLMWLRDCGVVQNYYNQVHNKNQIVVEIAQRFKKGYHFKALPLPQLYSAFLLYFFGVILGSVVFFIEILFYKIKTKEVYYHNVK